MLKTFNIRQALWHGAGPLAWGRPFGMGQYTTENGMVK